MSTTHTALLAALTALTFAIAPAARAQTTLPDYVVAAYGTPPAIPDGPLSADIRTALDQAIAHSFDQAGWENSDTTFDTLVATGDPRIAWLMADMMRFTWQRRFDDILAETAATLLGIEFDGPGRWTQVTDHLIAWEVPAYPSYLDHKRAVFTNYVPGWERIFTEGDIDWQMVSWGGVNIDDRPYDTTATPCNCIPATDNPEVSSAEDATWLKDDDIVFGIEVNGETRAYPRRIMEVREMVNDTLGGRDLGIPYCTLCGAAQAYFTDELPQGVERPVLRTSGLLIRSNKVMYDVNTYSVFDTFLGRAVTGPLAERGVVLDQASVVTTDWGNWRRAHPDTTVLVESLALGRDFDLRNTRDANGPIFPIGDVDPRLPVQEDVIGVTTASGKPVAFPRARAMAALIEGQDVTFEDVRLVRDAGGLRATDAEGRDLGSHQSFWFAWSQFHPGTELWNG